MDEKIVICEKEEIFVSLLAKQLKTMFQPKELTVLAFDDVEKMFADREAIRDSVVVIGGSSLPAFGTQELIELAALVIYLEEEKGGEGIFKYQSVTALASQILEKILKSDTSFLKTQTGIRNDKAAEIIGLYSPAREVTQCLLGLTLGQLLAGQQKVLYLNFEPYSGMEYLMKKEFSHDLTDLLFFIKNNEERFLWRLKSMVEKIGDLDYIPPVFSYPDLEEAEPSSMVRLIERIANETDYETVILDLADNRGIFSLLRCCDKIFCPYQNNGLAQAKIDQFEKMLRFLKEDQIEERTRPIKLPDISDYPPDLMIYRSNKLTELIKREMLS